MRALVPVAVVAIIAVTVLVIWLTARRRAIRAETLRGLRAENARRRDVIDAIQREAQAQLAAGNASHGYTAELIRDFYDSTRKGIPA